MIVIDISENGDMAQQYTMCRLAEGLAFEFFAEEIYLVMAEPCKIVQSGIHRSVIRLVLATVEQYETGIAPGEGTVGMVVKIPYKAVHACRIVVADFVIATEEDDRFFRPVHPVGQTVNHTDGIVTVAGFGQTVAIEDDKIIWCFSYQIQKVVKTCLVVMKVIEDQT